MSTQTPTALVAYLQQIKDQPTQRAVAFLNDQVNKLTKGAYTGTLSPDQRPKLAIGDAGTQFFSTDFARGYIWSGSSWSDLPDAPSRFGVTPFARAPEPPIGWAQCDGRTVPISTSSGGIASFTTPIVPFTTGLQYWMRL